MRPATDTHPDVSIAHPGFPLSDRAGEARAWLGRQSRAIVREPAEPGEILVPFREPMGSERWLPKRPFRPSRLQEVPAPALAALEAVCGSLQVDHLYVIPATTRPTRPGESVLTPARVLGFGETTVAMWVDDESGGHVQSAPIDRLIAIDDREILLYGRLRLLATDTVLTVRYSTVSREELQENLCVLRRGMASERMAIESGFLWLEPGDRRRPQAELPHKWRVVLDYPWVRAEPAEPALIAAGDVGRAGSSKMRSPTGIAVLDSTELVIATEPSRHVDTPRYGVDLLAVPRARLKSLSWDGKSLLVRLDRGNAAPSILDEPAPVTLTIDPYLVEAMWQTMGSAALWV